MQGHTVHLNLREILFCNLLPQTRARKKKRWRCACSAWAVGASPTRRHLTWGRLRNAQAVVDRGRVWTPLRYTPFRQKNIFDFWTTGLLDQKSSSEYEYYSCFLATTCTNLRYVCPGHGVCRWQFIGCPFSLLCTINKSLFGARYANHCCFIKPITL